MKPKFEIVKKELDTSHFYWVDGIFMPAVTSILDEAAPTPYALKQFMLNNNAEYVEDVKNTAGDFGSKIHDAIEKLLNGVELNLKDDYRSTKEKRHLASFATWFQDTRPEIISAEQTVASVKYQYAGTLDLVCRIDDQIWIIDFKTSSGIYLSHELQITAYKQAFEETFGEQVEHTGVLRTGTRHKAGYEFKEIERDIEDFTNIYKTYLVLHDGKIAAPPEVDTYPDTLKLSDLLKEDEE